MSIEVTNITKVFGKQKVLDQVNLLVKKGEIVGLLGPNGAGKSTLMKIITCFIPPTSGTVKVNDFEIPEASAEIRRIIGYLPENNPLYTDLYVKEYLRFIAGIHQLGKSTKGRIDEIIEMTGLVREQNKKIGTLSKGYRQRVGIAQALIHNPRVLILDEPTSGLDPNQILEIRNLISMIGKDKTVLLSTHIMQEVSAMATRAVIIHKGKIVADREIGQLQQLMGNTQTTLYLEFDQVVEKSFFNGLNATSIQSSDKRSWEITYPDHLDLRQEIFKRAVKLNTTILSIQKKELSLEEIFHELTMD